MNKSAFATLLTVILLAVSAFPATAGAERIPVTGSCELIGAGGWNMDHDPDFRLWENGGIEHMRNLIFMNYCDFSDDRLDGYTLALYNGDWFWPKEGAYLGIDNSHGYSADEEGNPTELWAVSAEGHLDRDWNYTGQVLYKGRGENQGLLAKLTQTNNPDGTYYLEGVLIIPGN